VYHVCGRRGTHKYVTDGEDRGKRSLGRPTHRWVSNIKIDLGEIGSRLLSFRNETIRRFLGIR
jgi:hypothetical protein